MIPLTPSDLPSEKASYYRRMVSGFQSVMPSRLLFDDSVEWDDRTAQLGGRRRRLSPLHMSTVDQSDSGDSWEGRWSQLPPTIERAAADCRYSTESACTSSASARARVLIRSDQDQPGDAERRRSHSDDDREAAYSASHEVRNLTDRKKRHRPAGPQRGTWPPK